MKYFLEDEEVSLEELKDVLETGGGYEDPHLITMELDEIDDEGNFHFQRQKFGIYY